MFTTEGVYRAKAERLYYIKGIKAELYFELDGQLGCVKVEDDTVTFVYGDSVAKTIACFTVFCSIVLKVNPELI